MSDYEHLSTDDLLAVLNDQASRSRHVWVVVRFLTEEPLAMLEGVLRTEFDVASEAGPDHAKIAAERRTTDTDALAIFYVGGGAFGIPQGTLDVFEWREGVRQGVCFREVNTPVETIVEW